MTAPFPSAPTPPYSADTRKKMATWILHVQDTDISFKLPFATIAALRLIAKDGGQHAISDETLQADYKVGTLQGKPTTPVTLHTVEQFLQLLTMRETWLRIGEGALGVLLIIAGVMDLTGAGTIGARFRGIKL